MDSELATLLTDLVEKIGLLRRDLKHRGDLERYEACLAHRPQVLGTGRAHLTHRPRSGQGLEDRLAASRPQPRLPEREAHQKTEPPPR